MLNYDELLQKKLDQLESGAPLETVLQDLPQDDDSAQEILSLIRLAAAVRNVPHPEPELSHLQAQRQHVMAAAIRDTQPAPRPKPLIQRPAWNWLTAGALLAGAGAMAIFFALVLVAAGFWFSSQQTDTARVEYMNGQVQMATNAAPTQWKNIQPGARLRRGDHLRTLGASNATLVYFEGTHTFVSPNSELTFTELNGSSGSTLQVKIDQTSGATWNKVTPFKGNPKSFFLVQTPSGTASVHGTSFNVKVAQSGLAQFSVDTGEVRVKNNAGEVTLQAGQTTTANPNGEIAAPTYQFNIQGSIIAMDEGTGLWNISGMQVKVTEFTAITGFETTPQFGDTVQVTGRVLADHTWLADAIQPATGENLVSYFTGPLEKNEGDVWQVGGQAMKVSQETDVASGLQIGDPVKVTYNVLDDGSWVALKIESLVEPPIEPSPTPTATSDPHAMPSYEFEPDELETPGCGASSFNLTGSLRDTASEAKDYAANVQLGYLIDRGGEYVSSVEITPSSWVRIDAGQTVTFNIHVTMNDAWTAAMAKGEEDKDTQVKLRIFVASATNRPDHLNGRLTVTIEAGCKHTPTPTVEGTLTTTPTGTLTPEITGTVTGTPTITPTVGAPTAVPTETGQCTGADPHPTGMKLAQRYGVPYDEIMKWFCQHYGFGEIDLAYSLSRQSGKPVEEIFAMRASGIGWGEIKKAVEGEKDKGGKDNKDNKGGKGNH
jgi:hypothetical protein